MQKWSGRVSKKKRPLYYIKTWNKKILVVLVFTGFSGMLDCMPATYYPKKK